MAYLDTNQKLKKELFSTSHLLLKSELKNEILTLTSEINSLYGLLYLFEDIFEDIFEHTLDTNKDNKILLEIDTKNKSSDSEKIDK
jgi:hypothetical protein